MDEKWNQKLQNIVIYFQTDRSVFARAPAIAGNYLLREISNRNSTDLHRTGQIQKGLKSALALFLAMKE